MKSYTQLKKDGISMRVIDCYSIKPLDTTTLVKAYVETKNIITVEDHYAQGGLGEAVASLGLCPHILAVNKMPHSGKTEELLTEQGINSNNISRFVKEETQLT